MDQVARVPVEEGKSISSSGFLEITKSGGDVFTFDKEDVDNFAKLSTQLTQNIGMLITNRCQEFVIHSLKKRTCDESTMLLKLENKRLKMELEIEKEKVKDMEKNIHTMKTNHKLQQKQIFSWIDQTKKKIDLIRE